MRRARAPRDCQRRAALRRGVQLALPAQQLRGLVPLRLRGAVLGRQPPRAGGRLVLHAPAQALPGPVPRGRQGRQGLGGGAAQAAAAGRHAADAAGAAAPREEPGRPAHLRRAHGHRAGAARAGAPRDGADARARHGPRHGRRRPHLRPAARRRAHLCGLGRGAGGHQGAVGGAHALPRAPEADRRAQRRRGAAAPLRAAHDVLLPPLALGPLVDRRQEALRRRAAAQPSARARGGAHDVEPALAAVRRARRHGRAALRRLPD